MLFQYLRATFITSLVLLPNLSSCNIASKHFVRGQHRQLAPSSWFVDFVDAAGTFDGLGDPEVSLSYDGPAPQTPNWYYKLSIMDPECKQFQLNGPILPVLTNGRVPDANYDSTTQQMTANVDINTRTIKNFPIFYTSGATPQQFQIAFCARMDLHGDEDMVMASENTVIKLSVDMTKEFQFSNFEFTNEDILTQTETVLVDYPLDIFHCDNSNRNIDSSIGDIIPGDVIQICIRTDPTSTGARVANLRSVYFKNDEDTSMMIPLVTDSGMGANDVTSIQCNTSGLCRLRTIAFARLFEKPNQNGPVEDISASSKLTGTAVLALVQRRRLNEEAQQTMAVTGFEEEISLATPPPPSSAIPPKLATALTSVAFALLQLV